MMNFSALQRAENSSMQPGAARRTVVRAISVLFSEPKIPQCSKTTADARRDEISVLFSEPKIPQFLARAGVRRITARFQCSSASRKFLNAENLDEKAVYICHFSALQRAENSSMPRRAPPRPQSREFQCSSASRKFLNSPSPSPSPSPTPDFSALQRAENSSIDTSDRRSTRHPDFSALQRAENSSMTTKDATQMMIELFQCSSASRKFLNARSARRALRRDRISVLFSEPKIPQYDGDERGRVTLPPFQCSSASRKFLNQRKTGSRNFSMRNFSALQRAENSSIFRSRVETDWRAAFQCSSASRKFLNSSSKKQWER